MECFLIDSSLPALLIAKKLLDLAVYKQMITPTQQSHLLALHRSMGLTYQRFEKLKAFFDNNWHSTFHASIPDLQASGIDGKGIENLLVNREKISPEKEMQQLEKCGARALICGEKDYPLPLENIYDPPVILFCRGKITHTDFPSISVVGSRKITSYGRMTINKIVGDIAKNHITIVSGLASGADSLAHSAALEHGARTIAVLGNGIDSIYPAHNHALAEKIIMKNQGAILSEYFPGTILRPEFFPVRNRIVAGLSRATIVIEAALKSGSLITARLANEQGKDVYAVPGEIFSTNSAGTNWLISEGTAHPALSGQQIMEDLSFKNVREQKQAKIEIPETGIEAEILKLFGNGEKMHIDDLMRKSNLPNTAVSSNILILEVKGLVKGIGNQVYIKNF